jgi:hypothetical protein
MTGDATRLAGLAQRACRAAEACGDYLPGDRVFVSVSVGGAPGWAARGYDGEGGELRLADDLAGNVAALIRPEGWALGDITMSAALADAGAAPVDRITRIADAAQRAVTARQGRVICSVSAPRRPGGGRPRSGLYFHGYDGADLDGANRAAAADLARVINAMLGRPAGLAMSPDAIARSWQAPSPGT